jgi:hypothetical protein
MSSEDSDTNNNSSIDNDIVPLKKNVKPIKEIKSEKVNKILSVLSYTLTPNTSHYIEKINKIINLIKTYKPDIIGLHNVELQAFNDIFSKISNIYYNVQVFKSENLQIGCVIFLKKETINIDFVEGNPCYFDLENSSLNRKIICVEITYGTKKINIITTHFDDKDENDTIRSEQFDILVHTIKNNNIKKCIVLGYFEINSTYEEIENKVYYSELKDSWIVAGCPTNVRNTYLYYRHDRILLYNLKKYKIISINLFGIQNISETIKQPPSENFGLYIKYEL